MSFRDMFCSTNKTKSKIRIRLRLRKVWFFCFVDPGSGASGAPRRVPLGYPWAFPGPPGASRRPPGPKTNQLNNLET